MNYDKKALEVHEKFKGKAEIASRIPIETMEDLSIAYTPGVAAPCRAIAEDPEKVWDLTFKGRTVAVVTDGSAVLGLGNIGSEAGLPVMEGKSVLFKAFADLDAWPILLDTQDTEEIISTVKHISPGFGAIQLEDISAPRCFEIEERLEKELNLPVMHDDQHGTAVVTLAGLMNALKVVNKKMEDIRVVISGAGAAGIAIGNILADAGVKSIRVLDSRGVISPDRTEGMNPYKDKMAKRLFDLDDTDYGTDLASVLKGADVFVGVSKPDLLGAEEVKTMNENAIIFALSNPTPEIMPDIAKEGGAMIVATGRSDFPNQVNNVLAYPGMFKGVLEARLKRFTPEMKVAAAEAIASRVDNPSADEILPSVLDKGLARAVADAVKSA